MLIKQIWIQIIQSLFGQYNNQS